MLTAGPPRLHSLSLHAGDFSSHDVLAKIKEVIEGKPELSSPLQIQLPTLSPQLILEKTLFTLLFSCTKVTVNCSATGDPDPVITWEPICTGNLPSERLNITEHGVTIRALQPDDQGKYACVATSALFRARAEFNLLVKTGKLIFFVKT